MIASSISCSRATRIFLIYFNFICLVLLSSTVVEIRLASVNEILVLLQFFALHDVNGTHLRVSVYL